MVFLLNKPAGISSFSALGSVKRALGTGKVGHCGTLDPFAEGLLIALSGAATKTAGYFTGLDKSYHAVMGFGYETDTLDTEGEIINTSPIPSLEDIESVIPSFTGRIRQTPPAYSAVKINGRRAYSLARNGETPDLPSREVNIESFTIIDWKPPQLTFSVSCSSGTYIRSLARDLAQAISCRGSLQSLTRTAIGPFTIEEAMCPDTFKLETQGIPIIEALNRFHEVVTIILSDDTDAQRILNGQIRFLYDKIHHLTPGILIHVADHTGTTLALLIREELGTRFLFVLTKHQ